MNTPEPAPSAASDTELRSWLRARVAHYAQRDVADITTTASLTAYGLDSVYALVLCGDIEDHLGLVLEPTVAWDHPTIDALARHLEEILAQAPPSGESR
ncbi:acyl carrier protein [Streptomyces brasiliscabiei]|uniref:Acyl carrier protein n=2 Tax=Streptomyces TaxID=1883 RepID=A0ABU8GQ36_9ACTN|nr:MULTISPECIES: acyl carrier protein [Streptomyces]MBZ3906728.1 acyl carrier protein [Streptomyces griseiscabiei]MDX2913793.1 acyl carrier protein [Streptomyces griseiscabiei]